MLLRRLFCIALLLTTPALANPKSFTYVLQADGLAKNKQATVEQLKKCDRDWFVLDAVYDDETKWLADDLKTIREGGSHRKILAYISIGEAEDYRPYWKKDWGTPDKLTNSAPKWLGSENPAWKGNYRVNYWNPEWQAIILKSIDAAMQAGFDGIYLDIVDGFESFEQQGNNFIDDRINPETKQSYRRDMVDWVKMICDRARSSNSSALVIPQNGSQLLVHPDFVETISGIGIEDLFTEGNQLQPESHRNDVLGFLGKFRESAKPVLVIEYSSTRQKITITQEQCRKSGFTWLITDRELKTLGTSGH